MRANAKSIYRSRFLGADTYFAELEHMYALLAEHFFGAWRALHDEK